MSAATVSFAEVYTSALRGEACDVVGLSPERHALPVATWNKHADPGDHAVVGACVGTTLDIGCGPGRMTRHLAERGHVVLGIDVVPEAVFQTRMRGVPALLRNVFGPVPGEGRWGSALLADGNIGIGGDPHALLRRVAELLEPGGRLVVDLAPPGSGVETRAVRLESRSGLCKPFLWTVVGADAIDSVAAGTGLGPASLHTHGDRWFAALERTA